MSGEQKQQELLRRRENYNQSKEKGKQVETSSTNNVASRVPFQNLTNVIFSRSRFQGTHDFEAGPSVRHINDTAVGHNFSSNIQGTHDFEAGPSKAGPSVRHINDTAVDSMDFDDNFAESPMPYVDTEVTANVTSTCCRRQALRLQNVSCLLQHHAHIAMQGYFTVNHVACAAMAEMFLFR
ncbi:hypothetical protein P8452_19109 [Trifolium repens]|nr:hypothetical protein P8452_19109 [Trifolium repens]